MSVRNVLIVGGGFTGLTTAIALAQRDVSVTLVDKAPAWARVGHGLTIQGNALRVFKEIGIIDEVLAVGQPEEGLTLTLANGHVLAEMHTPRTGGDDLPPTIGALRPDLHEILVAKAESLGVEIRHEQVFRSGALHAMDHVGQHVRRGTHRRQRQARKHVRRAVIGVGVAQVGNHHQIGPRTFQHTAKCLQRRRMAAAQRVGHLHVVPAQRVQMVGADAQPGQRGGDLASPTCTPPCARRGIDHEATFQPALRPGVVVAIGEEQHVDAPAGSQRALDEHAGGQRLVVGMRRNDQQAGAAVDDGMTWHGGFLANRDLGPIRTEGTLKMRQRQAASSSSRTRSARSGPRSASRARLALPYQASSASSSSWLSSGSA